MLFMMIVKASPNSEKGNLPKTQLQEKMKEYNRELEEAGVRILAKGLHPSSQGIRICHLNPKEEPVIKNGPFPNWEDVVAGFILIQVSSKEEAIKWAMKMPDPQGEGYGQVELRQIFE